MKQLLPMPYRKLTHLELINFCEQNEMDFTAAGDESFYIDKDFNIMRIKHVELSAKLKALVLKIMKSDKTAVLLKWDGKRDSNLVQIDNVTTGYESSTDEEEKEAATRIRVVLDGYKGLSKWSYQEETTGIDTMIAKFADPELMKDVMLIGILKPLQQLGLNNEEFKKVYAKRHEKEKELFSEAYSSKLARKELEECNKTMANYVLAITQIRDDAFTNTVLDILNNNRRKGGNIVATRDGRREAVKLAQAEKEVELTVEGE